MTLAGFGTASICAHALRATRALARLALADGGRARGRRVGLGLRPVVEVLPAPARRQPADVRPLAVALLEALLGGVAVLVLPVVVLLGDAEVDERA